MIKFYVTVRNTKGIIGTKELMETDMNGIKRQVTRKMKADGYTTVGKWKPTVTQPLGNESREFDKGTAVIEVIISDTETKKPAPLSEKSPVDNSESETKKPAPLSEYQRLMERDSARDSYDNHHVGEYVNLFFETKRAQIARIIKTQKGIRFIVKFKNAFSVMKPQELKRAQSAANQAKIVANARQRKEA